MRTSIVAAALLATGSALVMVPKDARACGCFAPPDPARPVVQAGERILFAEKDGIVTAHIQIQYQGDAEDFAWLVPLPSVPEVKVGVEELFTQIEEKTQPTFLLNQTGGNCAGGGGFAIGCSGDEGRLVFGANAPYPDVPRSGVLVKIASAGPYDYAVLDASSKQPMLDWLSTNHYFVPANTQAAIDPYIHPNAYFLALKLKAGESSGDLQPVVLQYESQYPMIPIVLTSVAATPDMGILVWVLGASRAVPRNYQHVVINEAEIDWINQAKNYGDVVRRAVDESKDHHAWVTEHAGSTSIMQGVIDAPGRFGVRDQYRDLSAGDWFRMLRANGFYWDALRPIFAKYIEVPESAHARGIRDDDYYANLDQYIESVPPVGPIDLQAMTDEIWERIVTPTLEAGALFKDHDYMTRMYTQLSPEEMTEDPVFVFNGDLPDVQSAHQATLNTICDEEDYPLEMQLSDGRLFRLKNTQEWRDRVADTTRDTPVAQRVEILREEGPPQIVVDNTGALIVAAANANDGGGCSAAGRRRGTWIINAFFMIAVIGLGRRVMRRR